MGFKVDTTLLKGSVVLLFAFSLFNIFNFLFQLVMARMLDVVAFGTLSALFAVTYILSIFTESLQLVYTRFRSQEKDKKIISAALRQGTKQSLKLGLKLFVVYTVGALLLHPLLNIEPHLLLLNGLFIFSALLLPVTRGLLQGSQRFVTLGINMIVESSTKFLLGILLVYIGLSTLGALVGTLIGVFLAVGFSFFNLRKIIKTKPKKFDMTELQDYSKPSFFIMVSIITFYSIDVIIARIVFDPATAGVYAIASVLGKILFWGTLPISKAMFPMHTQSSDKNLVLNATVILTAGVGLLLALFYFFPQEIIFLFSGKDIPLASAILFPVSLATGILSFTNLYLLYKLSQGKTKGYAQLIGFIVLEAILLFTFSGSLREYSLAFIVSSCALLWGSITLIK